MDGSVAPRAGRRARIFQIHYDEATRRLLDPAFAPLDNRANERPDWAEYWPISRWLARGEFDDDELLGFVSPRFREKTGLTGDRVLGAIAAREATAPADVYSFSPYFEQGVLFENPFLQGEAHHRGLVATMQRLTPQLGLRVDLAPLVCDQSTTIFANYFVAPGSLWREWKRMADRIFEVCEEGRLPAARLLTAATTYRATGYAMKVFVVERLITLLLETSGRSAAWLLDPRRAPRSLIAIEQVIDVLLILESLKRLYRQTGDPGALEQYREGNRLVRETLHALTRTEAAVVGG